MTVAITSKLKRQNIITGIFLIGILVVYSWIELAHFTTAYQEPDPDGYLILAKRIARGGPLKVKDDDIFMYQSHVWVENDSGEISPKFSPGYPLIMAFFYLIGGDDAMFVVSPLMGGIALIGAYLLFRLWMSNFAALIGTLCLATNTMFLIYSGYLLTHASNLCFIVWGMYFLWRWMREEEGNKPIRHILIPRASAHVFGAAAGLLLGFASIIRHTSILIGLVVMTAAASKWIEYWVNRKTVPARSVPLNHARSGLLNPEPNNRGFNNPLRAPEATSRGFNNPLRAPETTSRGFNNPLRAPETTSRGSGDPLRAGRDSSRGSGDSLRAGRDSSRGSGDPLRKSTFVLIACWAFFPLMLAIYNYHLFGNLLKSGYSFTNEQAAFSWSYFLHNLPIINKGLNYEALFLLMPLGLAGILLVGNITEVFMRIFWFLPIYIFYTAYYWAPTGMPYYRFLICTFPVVIGSAFALLDKIPRSKMRRGIVMIIFSVLLIGVRFNDTKNGLNRVVADPRSQSVAESSRIISKTLEDSAVIFSQPPVYCYLGTRKNFRLYDLRVFLASYGKSFFGQSGGARQQLKRRERLAEFYRQTNDQKLQEMKRNLIDKFGSKRHDHVSSRQVAYFIPITNLQREQKQLGAEFKFELLKEWKVHLSNSQDENWGLYEIGKNYR